MELITLQDLLLRLADDQRDLTLGTSSLLSGGPTLLIDDAFASTRDRFYQYSEIFFLEPAATVAGMTGLQPYVVENFTSGTGTFTLDKNWKAAGGIPAGLQFAIVRSFGQKTPYRAYVNALKVALDRLDLKETVKDISLSTVAATYDYTIPAAVDSIASITALPGSYVPEELLAHQWDLLPGRGLRLSRDVNVAYPLGLQLVGRKKVTLTGSLTQQVRVPVDEVIQYASEHLNRGSNTPMSQAKGQQQQQERLRYRFNYPLPNEREVIP